MLSWPHILSVYLYTTSHKSPIRPTRVAVVHSQGRLWWWGWWGGWRCTRQTLSESTHNTLLASVLGEWQGSFAFNAFRISSHFNCVCGVIVFNNSLNFMTKSWDNHQFEVPSCMFVLLLRRLKSIGRVHHSLNINQRCCGFFSERPSVHLNMATRLVPSHTPNTWNSWNSLLVCWWCWSNILNRAAQVKLSGFSSGIGI